MAFETISGRLAGGLLLLFTHTYLVLQQHDTLGKLSSCRPMHLTVRGLKLPVYSFHGLLSKKLGSERVTPRSTLHKPTPDRDTYLAPGSLV